mmetsp:Transcript_21955/g.61063  ORF Transcript_21955/g.61063 Transcript_21955/m.61063 type:complete len:84 (+) Transcript_21955:1358-1609(+)
MPEIPKKKRQEMNRVYVVDDDKIQSPDVSVRKDHQCNAISASSFSGDDGTQYNTQCLANVQSPCKMVTFQMPHSRVINGTPLA